MREVSWEGFGEGGDWKEEEGEEVEFYMGNDMRCGWYVCMYERELGIGLEVWMHERAEWKYVYM